MENNFFHKLGFHDNRRDVPADSFREMMNPEDHAAAFVAPGARTLRGPMNLREDAMYGIDPGLLFFWPREQVRARPRGENLGESVFLSVPLI